MGAYSAASGSLAALQEGFVNFVEEYKSRPGSKDLAIMVLLYWYFTANQGLYTIYQFIHCLFLAIVAAFNVDILLSYMAEIDADSGKEFSITQGHRALLFGLIMGFSGYIAGVALNVRADTILQMTALAGASG